MALFERPLHTHLPILLRVGFAARLRSEVADIYLTSDRNSAVSHTDQLSSSAVFFFLSGDSNASKPATTLPHASLAAVLLKASNSANHTFLSLQSSPTLTSSPCLLKVSLERAPNHTRNLFSLTTPGPHPQYLTLAGVRPGHPAASTPNFSKHCLFHFEILPESIGAGFVPLSNAHNPSYLHPSQALTHALLQLGVRFRLKSVHSTFLTHPSNSSASKNLAFLPPPARSATDNSVIFEAFMRSSESSPGDVAFRLYSLVPINQTDSSLNLPNLSPGVLPSFQTAKDKEKSFIRVRASPQGWGAVNLANQCHVNKDETSWLMAGRDGKLEMRAHCRAWETFTIECVSQSYVAALAEIPVAALYEVAERETRDNVRASIAQRVGAAKSSKHNGISATSTANKKKSDGNRGKDGFNHAAALGALSLDDASGSSSKTKSEKEKVVNSVAKKSKRPKSSEGSQGKGLNPTAGSSLPRNAANRKATKKNKKKKKKAAAAAAAAAAATGKNTTGASSSSSAGKVAKNPKSDASSSEQGDQSASSSSQSGSDSKENVNEKPLVASGPPCAACGRALAGNYVTAMGKQFHPHCFCCGKCRRPMGAADGQFRQKGGVPYCVNCYTMYLAERCARCSQPIMETVVTAMDKTWHKNCLTCSICSLPLTETFWLYADKPNEPRCSRCVTGDEHRRMRGTGGRMVNLPGFGPARNNGASLTPTFGDLGSNSGRVPLRSPVLPNTNTLRR